MNTAANFCCSLDFVTKEELINALHQSLMQFNAIERYEPTTFVDNEPVVAEITRLLALAGHIGFPTQSP